MNDKDPSPQYVVLSVDAGELTVVKMAIGSGVPADPYRHVAEYWYDGRCLRRDDPFPVKTEVKHDRTMR